MKVLFSSNVQVLIDSVKSSYLTYDYEYNDRVLINHRKY